MEKYHYKAEKEREGGGRGGENYLLFALDMGVQQGFHTIHPLVYLRFTNLGGKSLYLCF
jgi:hypothetical protein